MMAKNATEDKRQNYRHKICYGYDDGGQCAKLNYFKPISKDTIFLYARYSHTIY